MKSLSFRCYGRICFLLALLIFLDGGVKCRGDDDEVVELVFKSPSVSRRTIDGSIDLDCLGEELLRVVDEREDIASQAES